MGIYLPIILYLLLTTYYLLLITHYLLLTTYYILLTTYYLLLTTNYFKKDAKDKFTCDSLFGYSC